MNNLIAVINDPLAMVVGGAVRDRLGKRPILDLDIVVPKNASAIAQRVADSIQGQSFPLDEERGIFRVTTDNGHTIDLANWQEKTLEADLDRRDFTINALAVPLERWYQPDWKKYLVDRHKGLSHLKSHVLEPISAKIFRDDSLRLLRAFRISAELGVAPSHRLLALIKKDKAKIRRAAPERIREEWLKMCASQNTYTTLVQMEKTGLLDVLFPESIQLRKTAPAYYGKGGVLKHTLDSVKYFEEIHTTLPSWFPSASKKIRDYLNEKVSGHPRLSHCKWALLLHDIGKPKTARIIKHRLRFFQHEHVGAAMVVKMSPRYRWSSDETTRYAKLVRHHMRPGNLATQDVLTDKAIHRFFRDLEDDAISMLLVSLADHLTYLTKAQRKRRNSAHEKVTIKMVRRYYLANDRVAPPRLVSGHDVMTHLDIRPSPLVGQLMKDLQEAQSEGKIKTKEAALAYLKKAFESVKEIN